MNYKDNNSTSKKELTINYHYQIEKNEIIITFDVEKENIKHILVQQTEKEIVESSKPAHNSGLQQLGF